jgi:hypothetical protein
LKEYLKVFLLHVNENKSLLEAAFFGSDSFMLGYSKPLSLELFFLDIHRNQVKLADKPGSVVDSHSSRRFVT